MIRALPGRWEDPSSCPCSTNYFLYPVEQIQQERLRKTHNTISRSLLARVLSCTWRDPCSNPYSTLGRAGNKLGSPTSQVNALTPGSTVERQAMGPPLFPPVDILNIPCLPLKKTQKNKQTKKPQTIWPKLFSKLMSNLQIVSNWLKLHFSANKLFVWEISHSCSWAFQGDNFAGFWADFHSNRSCHLFI